MARLNDFLTLTDFSAIIDYVTVHGKSVFYAKNDCLVRQGSVCRHVGIVKSGYFKFVAYNTKGQEVVTGFSFVGDLITDYTRSFLFGEPCLTTIVAGCDAELMQVPINEARDYILTNNPDSMAVTASGLLQAAYGRYLDVLVKTPAERYNELLARCPGAIGSLPIGELASFLRVSRRQLHRIREAEKN